jgi:hypothetical protein
VYAIWLRHSRNADGAARLDRVACNGIGNTDARGSERRARCGGHRPGTRRGPGCCCTGTGTRHGFDPGPGA